MMHRVFALLLCAACSDSSPPADRYAAAPSKNVLVISVDTLRPDRLGCYGYERPTSPAIDAFAAQGVVFEQAYATSPWTKPSHASLFTGVYPNRHGALSFKTAMAPELPHLAQMLADSGFQTAAIVSNAWLTQDGLERGFEHFVWEKAYVGVRRPTPVTQRALEWFDARDSDKPFFAFIHYMDVHADYLSMPQYEEQFVGPYEGQHRGTSNELMYFEMGKQPLDATDAAHLSERYDAGIRQIDDQLAPLFDYLDAQGLFANTLVLFTSDHGEQFLEHGGVHHGHTQYEEVVRIPFILRAPDLPAAERVAEPVSLVDVLPTVLTWLGLPLPANADGLAIDVERREVLANERLFFFDASCTFPKPNAKPLRRGPFHAVRSGRFKLHYNTRKRSHELYDLSADPGETTDVSDQHPDVVERLLSELEAYFDQRVEPTPSVLKSAEFMSDIRAMGYAGVSDDE